MCFWRRVYGLLREHFWPCWNEISILLVQCGKSSHHFLFKTNQVLCQSSKTYLCPSWRTYSSFGNKKLLHVIATLFVTMQIWIWDMTVTLTNDVLFLFNTTATNPSVKDISRIICLLNHSQNICPCLGTDTMTSIIYICLRIFLEKNTYALKTPRVVAPTFIYAIEYALVPDLFPQSLPGFFWITMRNLPEKRFLTWWPWPLTYDLDL